MPVPCVIFSGSMRSPLSCSRSITVFVSSAPRGAAPDIRMSSEDKSYLSTAINHD